MKKITDGKFVISCGTCTYKLGRSWEETEILLVKQSAKKNVWSIPKGHLNAGETHEQCAARETKEETGIDVVIREKLIDTTISYKNYSKLVISYLAEQTCNNKPISNGKQSEVADARWFKISEIPEISSHQEKLLKFAIGKIKEYYDEKSGR